MTSLEGNEDNEPQPSEIKVDLSTDRIVNQDGLENKVYLLPTPTPTSRFNPIRKRRFPCPESECGKKFTSRASVKIHLRSHRQEKPYACDHCSYRSVTSSAMRSHTITHTGESKYKCTICPYNARSPSALQHHIVAHTNAKKNIDLNVKQTQPKRFNCSECKIRFTSRLALYSHLRKHIKKKPFMCNNCPTLFSSKASYIVHQKKHKRDLNLNKESKIGSTNESLSKKSMIRESHRWEKPHKCPHCHRTFAIKFKLNSHIHTHNENRYECDACNNTFLRKAGLETHQQSPTACRIKVKLKCKACGKSFTRKDSLRKHEISPIECPEIEKLKNYGLDNPKSIPIEKNEDISKPTVGEKDPLDISDMLKCTYCDQQFSRQESLVAHQRIHKGGKPYACRVCLRNFATQVEKINHMMTHSIERSHTCHLCSLTFGTSDEKLTHLRLAHTAKLVACPICKWRCTSKKRLSNHLLLHIGKGVGTSEWAKELQTSE